MRWLVSVVLISSASAWAAEKSTKKLVDDAARAWADGRTADCIRLLEAARAVHPTGRIIYNLAKAYERAQDTDNAIKTYELYLEQPDSEALVVKRVRVALTALYREVATKSLPTASPPTTVAAPPMAEATSVPAAPSVTTAPPVPDVPTVENGSTKPSLVPSSTPVPPVATVLAEPGPRPLRAAGLATFDPTLKPQLRDQATQRATVADVAFVAGGLVAAVGATLFTIDAVKATP